MENMLAANPAFYSWVVLPFLIFAARVVDVSMGTIRVIFISRGMKYLAPVVGFFEILVWLLAIGQIMQNLSSPICYIAYAGGFAAGNFVGIYIAEKLSLGIVVIRVITKQDASGLIDRLNLADYGVTTIEGQGSAGKVQVVFTIVPRREADTVVDMVKKFNPKAFYTIEEVGFVESGVFPPKRRFRQRRVLDFLWPFRKGK